MKNSGFFVVSLFDHCAGVNLSGLKANVREKLTEARFDEVRNQTPKKIQRVQDFDRMLD